MYVYNPLFIILISLFLIILFIIINKLGSTLNRNIRFIIFFLIAILLIGIALNLSIQNELIDTEPEYYGMEAILQYDNENNTTIEEIKEVLNNSFSKVWDKYYYLKTYLNYLSNSTLNLTYNKSIGVTIIPTERNANPDNHSITIRIELNSNTYDTIEDKKELTIYVNFIKELFYEKLNIPRNIVYIELHSE